MGTPPLIIMAFVPYARGYGYPHAGYAGYGPSAAGYGYGHGYGHPGAGYGAYGPTLEEVKKIRESEEKAFEDAVAKEKEFYEKERELVKKLGGYPYAFGGSHGYGYPGYAGAYAGHAGYGAQYGAGYGGYGSQYGAGYGHPSARGYGAG